MRKTFKICVSGMELLERSKAIEIMSRALVAEYSKATIVTHDGNATDKAIDAIPTHVDVFIVCSESHHDATGYERGTGLPVAADDVDYHSKDSPAV